MLLNLDSADFVTELFGDFSLVANTNYFLSMYFLCLSEQIQLSSSSGYRVLFTYSTAFFLGLQLPF